MNKTFYKTIIALAAISLIVFNTFARLTPDEIDDIIKEEEPKKSEKYYQYKWARDNFPLAEVEYILPDRTRVDVLTTDYAIEADFASKYAEAIGQSLYYSILTNKKAGILLILKKDSDFKYVERLMRVIVEKKLDIRLWIYKE